MKATDKQHGLVPESYETYQVVNEGNVIIRGTEAAAQLPESEEKETADPEVPEEETELEEIG